MKENESDQYVKQSEVFQPWRYYVTLWISVLFYIYICIFNVKWLIFVTLNQGSNIIIIKEF